MEICHNFGMMVFLILLIICHPMNKELKKMEWNLSVIKKISLAQILIETAFLEKNILLNYIKPEKILKLLY